MFEAIGVCEGNTSLEYTWKTMTERSGENWMDNKLG